jgi:hypothetical protein
MKLNDLRLQIILKWIPMLDQTDLSKIADKAISVYFGRALKPALESMNRAAKAVTEAFAAMSPEELAKYKAQAEANKRLRDAGTRGEN